MSRIGIVGAGAWGTALAVAACRAGHAVTLWSHRETVVSDINDNRKNAAYLPSAVLAPDITATVRLETAANADLILLVVPAQRMREIVAGMASFWAADVPAIVCSKGIEQGTGALMTQVLGEVLPPAPFAVLSGPTFAAEVADNRPTAATVAAGDMDLARTVAGTLATSRFRLYASNDPIGVQVGGAVKNVIAITAGIVDGRRLGDNARAALITRGLTELTRLAVALGARPDTLMGLAGLGDLTLTCSARQSRNFSLGMQLGAGRPLAEIMAERQGIAEGVFTARSVSTLAARLGVEMPICAAVDRVLHDGADLDREIEALLSRPLTMESGSF